MSLGHPHAFGWESDTFTATGNGRIFTFSERPVKYYSLQVTGTGAAATAWSVVIEGSVNELTFQTILTHATADGDGATVFSGASQFPCAFYRVRVASLTLGSATDIVVRSLGTF